MRKVFKTAALALGFLSLFTGLANAQTYSNGPLSTGTTSSTSTVAPTGYTWSEIQGTNINFGFGASIDGGFSVMDNFTVTGSWTITDMGFFAYSTGAAATPSPFNRVFVRIYNTDPSVGNPTPVWGDFTTNRFASSTDALMYRIQGSGTTRKIWQTNANIGTTLPAGTYWVEWQLGTTTPGASNFSPAVTIVGQTTQPGWNAKQRTIAGNTIAPLLDGTAPQDMPFIINYTTTPCAGTPTPGNTLTSAANVCSNIPYTLSLQTSTPGSGVTYQWQSSPTGVAGSFTNITGATSSTYSTSATATTYYRATVTCSGNTATSNPVVVTVTQCYCTAGATSTAFEKIARVQFGSINNASTSTAGYEDFTAISTPAYIGSSMPITVTLAGGFAADQVKVWIDLNKDFDFDDAGELVYTSANGVGPHAGNVIIPANVTAGSTRMRVRMHDTSLGANGNPCGTSTYGQVEDYTVNLVPCVPATVTTPPANVTVGCGGNATFTAVLAGSDSAAYWQYKVSAASTNWLDVPNAAPYSGVNTRILTITGAGSNLNGYQYRVIYRGACTGATPSAAATLTVNPLVGTVVKTPTGNICTGGIQQLSITNTQPATTVTFSSAAALNITIPDDASTTGVNNVIAVSGIPAGVVVTDIRIRMNITHSWAGDLVVVAKAPNNNVLNLAYALNGTGGAAATTGFNATFSKNAAAFASAGVNPYAGVYAADGYNPTTGDPTVPTGPNGFLPTSTAATRNTFTDLIPAAANSSTLNGNWTLALYDYYDDFTTTNRFNNWSVEITYTGGNASGVWTGPAGTIFTDAGATVPYTGTSVNTVYVKPTTNGVTNYSVIVNNGVCLSEPTIVPVTVVQLATSVSAVANQSICAGGNATFTATTTGGSGSSIQWQVSTDNGGSYTNITNGGVYTGATTGTLTITGAGANLNNNRYRAVASAAPCAGTVTSTAGILTVNALPTLVVTASPSAEIFPGQTATLAVASSTTVPATGYTWTRNGVVVAGATGNTLVVNIDALGEYSVSVTDANGCGNAVPATISVTAAANETLFIYPSPSTGVFQVRYFSEFGQLVYPRLVNIYDMKGSRVYSKSFSINSPYTKVEVDGSMLPKGIYSVELIDFNGKRIKTGRVVIN